MNCPDCGKANEPVYRDQVRDWFNCPGCRQTWNTPAGNTIVIPRKATPRPRKARPRKPTRFCRMAKRKQAAIREMLARIKLERMDL